MKILLITLLGILTFQNKNKLVNSVWSHKIAEGCINTLTFKSKEEVLEYDCELNYAFHSAYNIVKDTLMIKGKDDSHSEDHGKITSYWITKYLIKNNALYLIGCEELINSKLKNINTKPDKNPNYRRVK